MKNQEEIVKEFKVRQKRQAILAIIVFPLVIGIFIAAQFFPYELVAFIERLQEKFSLINLETMTYIFIALLLSLLGFSLFNWRCPSCNAYLGKNWNPKFCSNCWTKLQ